MTLEAFGGHGLESFIDSKLEARDVAASQLIVISALDESSDQVGYGGDITRLAADKEQALARGINFSVGVFDYAIEDGSSDVNRIVPIGEAFPSQLVTLLLDNALRGAGGVISQTGQEWANLIDTLIDKTLTGRIRVAIYLDDSGSMIRSQFGTVPGEALDLLAAKHSGFERRLTFRNDERWVSWYNDAWDDFTEDHL